MKRNTLLVGAALAVTLLLGIIFGNMTVTRFDTAQDAAVRVAAQELASSRGIFKPTLKIETILQFETCSTLTLSDGEQYVPVVAIQENGSWVASEAANHTNDSDDISTEEQCIARFSGR